MEFPTFFCLIAETVNKVEEVNESGTSFCWGVVIFVTELDELVKKIGTDVVYGRPQSKSRNLLKMTIQISQ